MNCRYHNLCALNQLWPLETSQELSSVLILINIGEYKITIFSLSKIILLNIYNLCSSIKVAFSI